MIRLILPGLLLMSVLALAADSGRYRHEFHRIRLTDFFWCEGANAGDFDRDGIQDICAGPYWWEGPDYLRRHTYYPDHQSFTVESGNRTRVIPGFPGALGNRNAYSDNFLCFVHDFNRDGWDDILVLGFPGRESIWYENPRNREGFWNAHVALEVTDNESPHFTDLTGDGVPEIVCNSGGYFGFAAPDPDRPEDPWLFRPVTPRGRWQRFTHGMGVGDVDGDGRHDIMEKDGWWEQPPSLAGDPAWRFHSYRFSPGGGAQMYAYDVDGDGDNDVITSVAAHGYGLAWYEHLEAEDGNITFKPHIFMNKEPEENRYGVKFSQLHALDLADMDGDGLMDIITGKRFWAHGPNGDAEPNAPAVLYWFKLVRNAEGVDYIPFRIDDDSGIGTQVVARDLNDDGFPEVIVGNKKGVFVHRHTATPISEEEWVSWRPRPLH